MRWQPIDTKFLDTASFDYPCILIGFARDESGRLGVVSWWHPIVENGALPWERREMDATIERLGKQLARVFGRSMEMVSHAVGGDD